MSLGEGAAAQPQAPPATRFVLCTFFFSSQRQDLSSSSHMSTEGAQFPLLAGLWCSDAWFYSSWARELYSGQMRNVQGELEQGTCLGALEEQDPSCTDEDVRAGAQHTLLLHRRVPAG